MGQQQLLLIVLSVIIVGIAVVVGINMFSNQSYASNLDAMTNDILQFGAIAQQFYVKPTTLGGGGQTFTGFDASYIYADTTGTTFGNDNGGYALTVAAQQVTILGTGTVSKDSQYGKVQGVVTPTNITISTGLGSIE